jgi:hypothetical protein
MYDMRMNMQKLQVFLGCIALLYTDFITRGVFMVSIALLLFWCLPTSEIRPVSEFDRKELDGKSTLHLKGFLDNIAYDDDKTKLAAKSILDEVALLSPACCVWDGYLYNETSFTRLIPQIYDTLNGEVQLIAFVSKAELESFELSWCSQYIPITIYTYEVMSHRKDISTFVLQLVGAAHVFCFGADEQVNEEFRCRPNKDVGFMTFHAHRVAVTNTPVYTKLCD